MRILVTRFLHDQSGVTAIEYSVIVAFIGLVIVSALIIIGNNLDETLEKISARL